LKVVEPTKSRWSRQQLSKEGKKESKVSFSFPISFYLTFGSFDLRSENKIAAFEEKYKQQIEQK
jgi:hypothetical protein